MQIDKRAIYQNPPKKTHNNNNNNNKPLGCPSGCGRAMMRPSNTAENRASIAFSSAVGSRESEAVALPMPCGEGDSWSRRVVGNIAGSLGRAGQQVGAAPVRAAEKRASRGCACRVEWMHTYDIPSRGAVARTHSCIIDYAAKG